MFLYSFGFFFVSIEKISHFFILLKNSNIFDVNEVRK